MEKRRKVVIWGKYTRAFTRFFLSFCHYFPLWHGRVTRGQVLQAQGKSFHCLLNSRGEIGFAYFIGYIKLDFTSSTENGCRLFFPPSSLPMASVFTRLSLQCYISFPMKRSSMVSDAKISGISIYVAAGYWSVRNMSLIITFLFFSIVSYLIVLKLHYELH